ncbi:MAG: GNAT family N-acetyltransferase [Planctomycetes bacterium]|nr:GNAT family N-acetyltransferase [Planctomycetota bacterium]
MLRAVLDEDLEVFFQQQCDAEACRLAAFPARSRRDFFVHWRTRVLGEPANVARTILDAGVVVGNVVSWPQDAVRLVGYWLGREFWGRGLATAAVQEFVGGVELRRPLHALVIEHNAGSIRVLEKCGFVRVGREGRELQFALGGRDRDC